MSFQGKQAALMFLLTLAIFINVDIKIPNKLWQTEFRIHQNKVEPISGMQGWFKIRKFINIINYIT